MKKICVDIDGKTKAKVKKICRQEGLNLNVLINFLIQDFIKSYEKEVRRNEKDWNGYKL